MKLHVGQGTTVGALTVFPVWTDQRVPVERRYDTGMDTATVSEMAAGPSVPQLMVTNAGERPLLILDGQLFEGGWQHRMATRSVVVRERSQLPIEVACVEQDRWGGPATQQSSGRRATTYVRHGFDQPGGQQEVWERIERYVGAGRRGSLADKLSDVGGQALVVRRHARPLSGQTGVLIGIGGRPLSLEVFDHPKTLLEQHSEILRAACMDAYGRPALPTPGRRARRMVERLARTRLDREPEVGQAAKLSRGSNEVLDVMSLQLALRTVHLRATHRRHPILQDA